MKNQFAIGLSYGAKTSAEVIKDKFKLYIQEDKLILDNVSEEQKDTLLNEIYDIIKVTLQTDIHEMLKVMNNISEKTLSVFNKIAEETLKNESETTEINETNNTNNENEKGEN